MVPGWNLASSRADRIFLVLGGLATDYSVGRLPDYVLGSTLCDTLDNRLPYGVLDLDLVFVSMNGLTGHGNCANIHSTSSLDCFYSFAQIYCHYILPVNFDEVVVTVQAIDLNTLDCA